MDFRKRITDYGVNTGILPRGPRNAITDVEGVRVGHCTLADGPVQTGVTAVLPHGGNLFREKLLAACHVINGFGKSAGLVQVEEMGTLETPVLLTNTFAVGAASEALVRHMLADNPDIGRETGTVNPVVCECNDGFLNDIRGFAVREEHVLRALASASEDFEEGAVGAGRGMSCHQLKGGIGPHLFCWRSPANIDAYARQQHAAPLFEQNTCHFTGLVVGTAHNKVVGPFELDAPAVHGQCPGQQRAHSRSRRRAVKGGGHGQPQGRVQVARR